MAEKYLSFLTSPSPQALSANASFHYITTTTTISEATAIVKHLQAQEKLLKKKSETVLSSVAGSDGVVIETETTIEFIRGGGAILPQMDDNMLADSVVVVPMVRPQSALTPCHDIQPYALAGSHCPVRLCRQDHPGSSALGPSHHA